MQELGQLSGSYEQIIKKASSEAAVELEKLIQQGQPLEKAVDQVVKEHPELFKLTGLKDALVEAVCVCWGIELSEAPKELGPALDKAWASDKMTLSQRLHGASKTMRDDVVNTIRQQMKANSTWLESARALYDGYGHGRIINEQDIPEYLKAVRRAAPGDLQALSKARVAMRNIINLGQGGAPNVMLKLAYKKFLTTALTGTEEAMQKAYRVAMEEKARYTAERIARTEIARAWGDAFYAEANADDDVVAVKWEIGSRHPLPDICDFYTRADLFGLGKGVYPKDKVPPFPAHPHCLCRLTKLYKGEVDLSKQSKDIKGNGNQYLQGLSKQQRQKILGVRNNQQYEQGGDWQKLLPNWQGLGKQGSRLNYDQMYKPVKTGTDKVNDAYHPPGQGIKEFTTAKILNSKYDLRVANDVSLKRKMLKNLESQLHRVTKLMGIKTLDEFPQVIIASENDLGGALGAYRATENKLFINCHFLIKKNLVAYLASEKGALAKYSDATLIHELFHWKDAMDYVHKHGRITDQNKYVEAMREYHKHKVYKLLEKGYNIRKISQYAYKSLEEGRYDEVMTEYRTLKLLEGGGKK